MSEFTWNDRFKIGHSTVDSQHQRLFGLANQIVEASNDEDLTHSLMLLYQHTREHFAAEENLMKQTRYPDYERHVEQHNQMLDRLIEISKTVQKKQWNPTDIKIFMTNWVLVHILEDDVPLGEYLNQTLKASDSYHTHS